MLVTVTEPDPLVKKAVLVGPFTESQGVELPAVVPHPEDEALHGRLVIVFVMVAPLKGRKDNRKTPRRNTLLHTDRVMSAWGSGMV